MLLIFDLNGTLCHMNKNTKLTGQTGIYKNVKPFYEEPNYQLYGRPSLDLIKYGLLV